MNKIPMTPTGFAALEAELKELKDIERPAIIEAIAEARELGDLKENAEYHSARERQGFIEGRITEIESMIAVAEVIDPKKLSGDTIKFGATVELEDEETEQVKKYMIVGSEESDVSKGLIAFDSPVARAIIGKSVGDFVEVQTPKGIASYEVLKVSFN